MAKNKNLNNRWAFLYKKIDSITPQIYAAIAISLHRKFGWGYKRINDLFVESQEVWNECVSNGVDMVKKCEDETGIECRSSINSK